MFICLQYGEPPQNEFMSLDCNLQRSWDFGPLWDQGAMGQNSKKMELEHGLLSTKKY